MNTADEEGGQSKEQGSEPAEASIPAQDEKSRKQVKMVFHGGGMFELGFPSAEAEREYRDAIPNSRLVAYLRAYLDGCRNLLATEYSQLREYLPRFLTGPVRVLAMISHNGVAFRFDPKAEEPSEILPFRVEGDIRELAIRMSEGFLSFDGVDAIQKTLPDFRGPGVTLSIHESGGPKIRDVGHQPLNIRQDFPDRPLDYDPRRKPFCSTSITNELGMVMEGLEVSEVSNEFTRPFTARKSLPMGTGWICMEIYPHALLEHFDASSAQSWAERDILRVSATKIAKELAWHKLASQAAFRKAASLLLEEFELLLAKEGIVEEDIQKFLERHPELLSPSIKKSFPKIRLGKHVTDFVIEEAGSDYLLIELEPSNERMFVRSGHFSKRVNHAIGQIIDWKRYIADNKSTVQKELNLPGISSDPRGLVVIGRSRDLSAANREHLGAHRAAHPRIEVITYDELIAQSKKAFENFYGKSDADSSEFIYHPDIPS